MPDNPYATSTTGDPPDTPDRPLTVLAIVLVIVKYGGAYLLGIAASILFTPAGPALAGVPLLPAYVLLAPLGVLAFYLYLDSHYLPYGGTGLAYWTLFAVGFLPIVMELIQFFAMSRFLRAWRPLWIGFPIGLVGTLGVYYTAAASI